MASTAMSAVGGQAEGLTLWLPDLVLGPDTPIFGN